MDRRLRSFLVLLLLGVHVWLPPFAHADPADPIWMGGYFDDADYDDVVLLVMAMTSVVAARPVLDAPTSSEILPKPAPGSPVDPPPVFRVRPIRAPPPA